MLNRTKGYVLLILLVVTGLASQVAHKTISGKERNFLAHSLKIAKNNLQQSIKGLNKNQLNFKPAPNAPNIKQCLAQLTAVQDSLWAVTQSALAQKPRPALQSTVSDMDILKSWSQQPMPAHAAQKTFTALTDDFTEKNNSIIKYVKTTTEDVRRHTIASPVGNLDAYQMLLAISAQITYFTTAIEKIKTAPGFPQ